MSYPQPLFRPYAPVEMPEVITFCSCKPFRTELEQIPTKREIAVMWIKDAAAGAGLVIFMVSSFVLASGAHVVMNIL